MTKEMDPAAMSDGERQRLFWACFIALIATAFGFIVRAMVMDEWAQQFGLSGAQRGEIFGVGLWPFAISIVLFSLVIDYIGYGRAMIFAFVCHIASAVITIAAVTQIPDASAENPEELRERGYWMLYLGNLIVALGNGTVEAVINPVVATIFAKEKTKWLNILHAGWPGGLVLGGLLTIGMSAGGWISLAFADGQDIAWPWKVALLLIPTVSYAVLMLTCRFPVQERVAAGVSYEEMLQEVGFFGMLFVSFLICFEVGRVIGVESLVSGLLANTAYAKLQNLNLFVAIAVAILVSGVYGLSVRAWGQPLFVFLLLIMVPLATTELGTDSWITSLLEGQMKELGQHAGWVLVYTSLIMMVLRFFAGPIVHAISPLGLLAASSVVAAFGLFGLSWSTGYLIFGAATIYGIGKTFFWPTMLGVVAERFPKGGALTLNAIAGVGMLGVGVVGAQFMGFLLDSNRNDRLAERDKENKTAYVETYVTEPAYSLFGDYKKRNDEKFSLDTFVYDEAQKIKIKEDKSGREEKKEEDAKLKAILADDMSETREEIIESYRPILIRNELEPLAERFQKSLALIGDKPEKAAEELREVSTSLEPWQEALADPENIPADSPAAKVANLDFAEEYRRGKNVATAFEETGNAASRYALLVTIIFPAFMFVCYVGLIVYFMTQGGYKAEELTHAVEDDETAEKFAGGVEGPVE